MKKFLSILLSGAFLAALAICLTGCEGMVTERQMKTMVEKALKEKYGEEFECIQVFDITKADPLMPYATRQMIGH